jgi:hypothetical protein
MIDPKAGMAVTTETTGALTTVPVIVQVIDGVLRCTPDHVVIFGGEQVEWTYHPGDLKIDFNSTRPFGNARLEMTGVTLRSGPNDCEDREIFKYTITVTDPSVKPLDPMVDADPRKRPPTK